MKLPLRQAVGLGLMQGPAELLPVSSSGHLVLVPALLGWSYVELDDELRKSFEVALHAGTALALLIALRHEVDEVLRDLDGARLLRHALSFVP
ncbi:MAG: undecaprenyl-diphosphatase, partial [Thermoleophilaceae bacterium]|nr:undecaprenyl-diphosphatase [Thermoleophilaceae bacterium]